MNKESKPSLLQNLPSEEPQLKDLTGIWMELTNAQGKVERRMGTIPYGNTIFVKQAMAPNVSPW